MKSKADFLIAQLVPILGANGIKLIEAQLKELTACQEGWQKIALTLTAEAVTKFGPGGVKIAMDTLTSLMDGKVVKLDWADLATASDVLVQFENAEADKKSEMKIYLTQIGQVVGIILSGIIKGLI